MRVEVCENGDWVRVDRMLESGEGEWERRESGEGLCESERVSESGEALERRGV